MLCRYCIGALSKKSAWKVAYFRGLVSETLAEKKVGGMMAVALPAAQIQAIIDEIAPSLTIACINSPEGVTVSGERQQLQTLAAALNDVRYGPNIFHRQLMVQVAYHSPQMCSVADEYRSLLEYLEPGMKLPEKNVVSMISSVTGELIEPRKLSDADYWVQNMLEPVKFSDALTRLLSRPLNQRKKLDGSHRKRVNVQVLVEIGPHSALQGPVREILRSIPFAARTSYYSALKRQSPADHTTMIMIGQLFCHGFPVDLNKIDTRKDGEEEESPDKYVLPILPEYPFDTSRKYWTDARLGQEYRFRRNAKLDLLGKPATDWNPLEARWTNFFKLSEIPWAADHKVSRKTEKFAPPHFPFRCHVIV